MAVILHGRKGDLPTLSPAPRHLSISRDIWIVNTVVLCYWALTARGSNIAELYPVLRQTPPQRLISSKMTVMPRLGNSGA